MRRTWHGIGTHRQGFEGHIPQSAVIRIPPISSPRSCASPPAASPDVAGPIDETSMREQLQGSVTLLRFDYRISPRLWK